VCAYLFMWHRLVTKVTRKWLDLGGALARLPLWRKSLHRSLPGLEVTSHLAGVWRDLPTKRQILITARKAWKIGACVYLPDWGGGGVS
jgi:hypothetical protein